MIVTFLPCVAPARCETQASSLGIADVSRLPGHRTAFIGMAWQRSAVKNAGRGCGAALRALRMPPSYRALALRMWLSSVVFPAPRKPVRMVTGTRRSSSDSSSVGAILRVGMTGLGAEVSGSTAGAPSSQERAWGGKQLA